MYIYIYIHYTYYYVDRMIYIECMYINKYYDAIYIYIYTCRLSLCSIRETILTGHSTKAFPAPGRDQLKKPLKVVFDGEEGAPRASGQPPW